MARKPARLTERQRSSNDAIFFATRSVVRRGISRESRSSIPVSELPCISPARVAPVWRRFAALDDFLPRYAAVAAYLHEREDDLVTAARLDAEAAHQAPNLAERDHLTRQAARLIARR